MTKKPNPSSTQSPPQASAPLTAANIAIHRRSTAAALSNTSSRGVWVSNGEVALRHAPPNQEEWKKLVNKDPIAAEIEEALRAASQAKGDQGN
jgi:hypothetical protein